MPGRQLGQRAHRGDRTQVQWLLQQAGRDRVVHDHGRIRGRGQPGEPGQIRDPKQRVGWRLRPQHRGARDEVMLDLRQVEQVGGYGGGAVRPQPVGEHPGVVVAVTGEHDLLAPLRQREHQRHRRGLARGEDHRFGVLDHAEGLLQRLPARVSVPPVGAGRIGLAPGGVHAGRDQRRRGGRTRKPLRARVDQFRLRRERVLVRRGRVLVRRERVLVPRERVLVRRERVPRERVLVRRERVPRERVLMPRERVLARR